jgi:Fur family ferric uptake transcriptional regulator
MGAKRVFREYLERQDLRFTKEREAILDEVSKRKGHFDPEELHYALRNRGHNVSRASVYRTIPLLVEAGLLEEVERTHTHSHYENAYGKDHHDHMLCLECGKVVEFFSEELENIQDRVCAELGFEGVSHTLEIKGYCPKCAKKRKRGI